MSRFRSQDNYSQDATHPDGRQPTNVSWVGPWVRIDDVDSIGFIVALTGTGSPTSAFTLDVTDDPDANKKTDAQLTTDGNAPTDWALTAGQKTLVNPTGTTANFQVLVQFTGAGSAQIAPCPAAKWCRLKNTVASGGSALLLLRVSVSLRGI